MNNLSNERLAELANKGMICICQDEEYQSMARELLARREAEGVPVGFRWRHETHNYQQAWTYVYHRSPDEFEKQNVVQMLFTAPPLPVVLPCSVKLEPGLILGKGVRTQALLDALCRREKYYAELDAMTQEQRAEHEEGIASIKSMLAAAPSWSSET